ncbi:Aspartic peptidase [Artemisia annua]|uniref:Aspartic peptidase n=1 Tax=Artemisia annua TaxID=35608 RepID=A0A2U1KVX9_ARTAN|nr:Aspartic peptidase [Artemisia annua]
MNYLLFRGSEWTGKYVMELQDLVASTPAGTEITKKEAKFSFIQGGYIEDPDLQAQRNHSQQVNEFRLRPNTNTPSHCPSRCLGLHYAANVTGISVGAVSLNLSTSTSGSGKIRTQIDSGSTLAHLPDTIYKPLVKEIVAGQPGLRLRTLDYYTWVCLDEGFPAVTFYFENSLRLTVYPHDYLFHLIVAGQPGLRLRTLDYYTWVCLDEGFPAVTFYFENSLRLTVYPHDYLFHLEGSVCFGWQNIGTDSLSRMDTMLLGEMTNGYDGSDQVLDQHLAARTLGGEINRVLGFLQNVGSRGDIKQLAVVCGSLLIAAIIEPGVTSGLLCTWYNHQALEPAMPEAKQKTIANQFHEALAAASTNEEEQMYAAPRNTGVGLFGKLQHVMHHEKERDTYFLNKLPHEGCSFDWLEIKIGQDEANVDAVNSHQVSTWPYKIMHGNEIPVEDYWRPSL